MTATFWDARAECYDNAITTHDAVYDQTVWATAAMLRNTDEVLDLGCASGEFALDIAPTIAHLHGIDVSREMIALAESKARQRGIPNVEFHQADIFGAQLAPGSVSAVLAFNILHLVPDVARCLRRVHHLLADDGVLISKTPCLAERSQGYRALVGLAQFLRAAPPIASLTLDDLTSAVTTTGFDIEEARLWEKRDKVYWLVARKRRADG
jgi:2-polyprenyl-3-methyl-5-hydroxy-6-metoxy-1,4-benzoquinol methylase